jgi:hypothetical protein
MTNDGPFRPYGGACHTRVGKGLAGSDLAAALLRCRLAKSSCSRARRRPLSGGPGSPRALPHRGQGSKNSFSFSCRASLGSISRHRHARTLTSRPQHGKPLFSWLRWMRRSPACRESGKVVLVHEAIVGGEVPDVTQSVKTAVYAKVPRPQPAQALGAAPQGQAARVEQEMQAFMAANQGRQRDGKP